MIPESSSVHELCSTLGRLDKSRQKKTANAPLPSFLASFECPKAEEHEAWGNPNGDQGVLDLHGDDDGTGDNTFRVCDLFETLCFQIH